MFRCNKVLFALALLLAPVAASAQTPANPPAPSQTPAQPPAEQAMLKPEQLEALEADPTVSIKPVRRSEPV